MRNTILFFLILGLLFVSACDTNIGKPIVQPESPPAFPEDSSVKDAPENAGINDVFGNTDVAPPSMPSP